MKKVCSFWLAFLCTIIAYSQCNDYYVLEQGTEWTYENFGKNGKTSGKNQQKVTAYEKIGNGYKATINSVIFSDKGKKLMEGDLEMTCQNGVMIMDMRKFIPEEQQKAFSSYEMKMESENLELPSKLSAGQTLKNGSITMTATGSPIPMNMSVQITDRKVVGKETITTPAGTFDCYKITSKSTTQSKMGVSMSFEFATTEWIAEKVGMVKSESFDKNGKSAGYTLLVSRK
ncbi:MAG TPA: hypothetical protein PLV21_08835 [Cyclobacteriaceae bacterium]|nr:hypothetical protein [Cyclobacteriaceae bacterium]HRJ81976.1 hypothetical protein [Cyclobacteriaceae bacterium]